MENIININAWYMHYDNNPFFCVNVRLEYPVATYYTTPANTDLVNAYNHISDELKKKVIDIRFPTTTSAPSNVHKVSRNYSNF